MASKFNSTPEEELLLSICRLEFYKKKTNWKFVQDVCKKDVEKVSQEPPPSSEPQPESTKPQESKSTLDETYDVVMEPEPDVVMEPEPDAGDGNPHLSMLNDVFMGSDLDQNQPSTSRGLAAGGWPGPNATPDPHHSWSLPYQGPDLSGLYGPEAQGAWSSPSVQEWGREGFYAHLTQSPACGEGMFRDEWRAGAVLTVAEDHHRVSPHPWRSEDDCHSLSNESLSEFIRGAAAAPHSSEIELSLSNATSKSSLGSISSEQLAACVSKHTVALRILLQEAELRVQHSARPQTPLSLEYPTPNQQDQQVPTGSYTGLTGGVGDQFVAGSFRNVEVGTGRGRGRLNRERLIGIGMGRPYRLSRED